MSDFIPTGSLEQMGIAVETSLPEGALTPAVAKGVKFTQTKPGYHFREVEAYKETVDYTLEVYAQLLHQRDLDVHKLGAELDRAHVDVKNLQNQIEVYEFTGGIAQANAEDAEFANLLQTNEQLRQRITQLEAEKSALENQLQQMNEWADSVTAYVSELEAQLGGTPAQTVPTEQVMTPEAPAATPDVVEAPQYVQPVVEEPQPQQPAAPNAPYVGFPGIRPDDLE